MPNQDEIMIYEVAGVGFVDICKHIGCITDRLIARFVYNPILMYFAFLGLCLVLCFRGLVGVRQYIEEVKSLASERGW